MCIRDSAFPDDPGQEGVGVGDGPVLVEHPGVEAEPATAPGVLSDERAVAAQTCFGQERVRAGQDLGRAAVRREAAPPVGCLLYTSDAADDLTRVDLGGRRLI